MKISSQSTWKMEKPLARRPKLSGSFAADVAIIGGGMTGILNAYVLTKAGKKVALLEAERLLDGVTLYTTAFLTQVIDTDARDMISLYGLRRAREIWRSHGQAISLIENIIAVEGIECEFRRCNHSIYAVSEKEIAKLKEEQEALRKLGARTVLKRKPALTADIPAYLEIKDQAMFHPLKFLHALLERIEANGAAVFEKSRVEKIRGRKNITLVGQGFSVKAEQVITATYQPFDNPLQVFLKKGMYRSYVFEARLTPGRFKEGTYEDLDNPYHYFRIDKRKGYDRLIFGGEDHRQEIKLSERQAFASLQHQLEKLLGPSRSNGCNIVRRWSSLILEPSDGLALIGEYEPRRLLATAFSGNGMTYAAISALVNHDIISGKRNSLIGLYDPTRIPTLKQLAWKGADYGQEMAKGVIRIVASDLF